MTTLCLKELNSTNLNHNVKEIVHNFKQHCLLSTFVYLFVLATEHTLLRMILNIWCQILFPRDLHVAAP